MEKLLVQRWLAPTVDNQYQLNNLNVPNSGYDQCSTVSGADPGAKCVFPFTFDGKRYSDCTTTGSTDGKAWCSTRVDNKGRHIGGKGNWGHCPAREGYPPSTFF